MTASEESRDLCVVDCSACGAHNIARAEPQGGFNRQPRLVVLRTVAHKPEAPDVFTETVEPGVDVHPVTRGKSD
ncbi:hypothetical protein [Lentisalinibacter sediminis]|uniref:hypothetical protein n=1 Tax=Lentisalinibacter sediminis TaxID=2992237 RepID=UPI00386D5996